MAHYIALLRGINVGGHNKIPMAELRALCSDLGWSRVESYIQSGNIVFASEAASDELEAQLEKAIKRSFSLSITVIIRNGEQWQRYASRCPILEAAEQEPNRVYLALSKAPPNENAAAELQKRATKNESVTAAGDALWAYFPQGAGTSKLTPSVFDKSAGSPVTMRNWRTVQKLRELVGSVGER